MNRILSLDLTHISERDSLFFPLEGSTVLITGATGLIGSLLIKSMLTYNQTTKVKIKVIAFARNRMRAEEVFRDFISESPELTFYFQDISEKIEIEEDVDYIIHAASITSSRLFVNKPVETIHTTVLGCENVLSLGRCKKVKTILYLSSLEVYGTPAGQEEIHLYRERDFGYLDPCLPRSSYSEGKRLAECLCTAYYSEYGLPIKIARLTQTFGPGVIYEDARVFAEFARCAIEGKDIHLHTRGETVRNYCYTVDAISAILTILTSGKEGEVYNVANKNAMASISELAEIVKSLSQIPIEIRYEIDGCDRGYNPEMKLALATDKIEQLGWTAEVGLKEMFRRLIMSMAISKQKEMTGIKNGD